MIKISIIIFFLLLKCLPAIAEIEIKFKIDDNIITNIDIINERKYLIFLRPNLNKLSENEIEKISIDTLIRDIIKKKEIDKVFTKQPSDNFIKEIKNNLYNYKKVKNESEFINLLKENNIKYDKIIEKIKYEALWNDLVYRKFNSLVKIDKRLLKDQLKTKLANNKQYEYNLSELLFEIGKKETLGKKYNKIKNYINLTDFKTAASKYSISSSNNRGGEIGWVKETLLSVNLSKILSKMKINQITDPIEYPNGYLILKLNDKKEMKQIKDINKELDELIKFEKNRQLNQFSLLYYKKLRQNTVINEN